MSILPREFFERDPVIVAHDLLGKRVVRLIEGHRLVGRIVEAEGYRGDDDAASHAFRGPTPRNAPMFGPAGHAYVYFIYGMHWMFNVIAHTEGVPGGILIRALEPLEGLELMRVHRGGQSDILLTRGPARLAQALCIDASLNGIDLCSDSALRIEEGSLAPEEEIACGPRIRVPGDHLAGNRPWRFWIRDHPYVSS